MPSTLERVSFSIITLKERTLFYKKREEVQRRLREFTDSGHVLDPTVLQIFAASAHNEEPKGEGDLVCTAPLFFDCPEGITMGALLEKEKNLGIKYKKTDADANFKVNLVPRKEKPEVYQDYQAFWVKHGFKRCFLLDVLDLLPQVENLGCDEVTVAKIVDMRETGKSLLVFKKGTDGKYCLFRIKYDPDYLIGPTEQLLFRAAN